LGAVARSAERSHNGSNFLPPNAFYRMKGKTSYCQPERKPIICGYVAKCITMEVMSMRDLMAVIKALADENRVRILMALAPEELCVCQIVELLGLAPSTVSKHMAILKQARLVNSRKEGRWMFYRHAEEDASIEAKEMTALVSRLLANDVQEREDIKRLKQILKMDRDELCRKQNRC
jgi:ArsR family transcriptional regulator, arsenate/arsenite/antimonite-responsive transcriptional repressor